MRRVVTAWTQCRARLGAAGLCGIAIAVAGVATHAGLVQPRASELAALAVPAAGASPVAMPRPETAEAATRFAARLPAAGSLPDWLEHIEAAASTAGVTLERTEYRVSNDPAAGLARYQITLPVKGAYPQVRAFASALLETVPVLAITSLDMKRDTTGASAVEARLDVALYLRADRR